MRQYLDTLKGRYSHILIDWRLAWDATVNASAAHKQDHNSRWAGHLPAKRLEQLLSLSLNKVKRQINPKLQIDGILITDNGGQAEPASAKISALLQGRPMEARSSIRHEIHILFRAKEISAESCLHDRRRPPKVAGEYKSLTKVLKLEKLAQQIRQRQ